MQLAGDLLAAFLTIVIIGMTATAIHDLIVNEENE